MTRTASTVEGNTDGKDFEEWRWSIIISLYKYKRYIQHRNNCRGIKLLSHTMKIWERVVELKVRISVPIFEKQFGLMSQRRTSKVIHLVRRLVD